MEKVLDLVLIYEQKERKITIQSAKYIEDGWYINKETGGWGVYEIPLGGGREQRISFEKELTEAIDIALNLR